MLLIYDLLLFLLLLPAFMFLAIRYRNRLADEFFYLWKERLAIWEKPAPGQKSNKPLIWIHCASLGEIKAAQPLIDALQDYRVLLTTLTLTGHQYAHNNKIADYRYFVPIDFGFLIKKAIKIVEPSLLILIETEFWPGLVGAFYNRKVPVVLVNGRLSKRSFPYYRFFRIFWKHVLKRIDRIAARYEEDAQRFAGLGYSNDRIEITGNLKYEKQELVRGIRKTDYGFNEGDFVLVCGSTRTGEDELIISSFCELKKEFKDLKLVIAPRHITRVKDIAKILNESKVLFGFLSKSEQGNDCLLVDNFGELQKMYSMCDAAFVGGSFVDKGGQNPIEPAMYSKAVLYGPFMDNFLSEARILSEAGGAIQVLKIEEFKKEIGKLIKDDKYRQTVGNNAKNAVDRQKGALPLTVEMIKKAIKQ